MSAKKQPDVPTEARECEVHGVVDFRLHKVGIDPRTGNQKTRWRCPLCHTARNR